MQTWEKSEYLDSFQDSHVVFPKASLVSVVAYKVENCLKQESAFSFLTPTMHAPQLEEYVKYDFSWMTACISS